MESIPDGGDQKGGGDQSADAIAIPPSAAPAACAAGAAKSAASASPPPTKTVHSVTRTVVNAAETVGRHVIPSGVWTFYQKLSEPVEKGKNTRCIIVDEQGEECGRLYRHIPKNGTRPLLDHLEKNHKMEYDLAIAASNRTKRPKQATGQAFAAAGGQPLLGSTKKAAVTPQLTDRLDRLSVIWCVRNGRPWQALKDVGFKLLMAEFVPEYAATDTSHETLDKILSEMYDNAKASVTAKLMEVHEELVKMGYGGPFCSLRLDSKSVGNDEFCSASVAVILPGKQKTPVHFNLASKVFRGQHTKTTIQLWIEEMTLNIFGSFMPAVVPADVYVAACVGQGRLNVVDACKALNIPTLLCLGHRINSVVMWATGVNGSSNTQKNKPGRALVAKCAACTGMFSHSCTSNDAFRALQDTTRNAKQREKMEQFRIDATDIKEAADGSPLAETAAAAAAEAIPGALSFMRHPDARWEFLFRFLESLCILEEPVSECLKSRPDVTQRGLSPAEWKATKELCCLLEPLKIVTVKIQGGGVEGLLSRAIYLCHDVGEMLRENEIETIDWVSRRAGGDDAATPGPMVKTVDLSEVGYTALKVIAEEFKKRDIGVPVEDVELLALFFDPRTKGFGGDICGGEGCKDKAHAALGKVSYKLADTAEVVDPVDAATTYVAPPPEKRRKVATNAYERRQRLKEEEAAASVRASTDAGQPSIQHRLKKEVEEYEMLPAAVPARDFDVLGYWRDAGSPRVDPHGNVIAAAQFPILSMLARVYLCVDGTSCQSDREVSGLGFAYNHLRQRMTPERVEKMMFLRSNSDLIPEINTLEHTLANIAAAQPRGKATAASVRAARGGRAKGSRRRGSD